VVKLVPQVILGFGDSLGRRVVLTKLLSLAADVSHRCPRVGLAGALVGLSPMV